MDKTENTIPENEITQAAMFIAIRNMAFEHHLSDSRYRTVAEAYYAAGTDLLELGEDGPDGLNEERDSWKKEIRKGSKFINEQWSKFKEENPTMIS